ncbi:MAG TPA: NAD(P)/FAD-dependent oxidoreductase [Phycisphaerae bacterium]
MAAPGERPHVVIVGGGFGGLEAAKALARAPVRITLIDRCNHHLFQPLLYQVAMAGLSPANIAAPIRAILRHQRNVAVRLAEVLDVHLQGRAVVIGHRPELGMPEARAPAVTSDSQSRVQLDARGERVPYDYLILATGTHTNYFGHDEWAKYAIGLKTIEDALEVRRRVLTAFEEAEQTDDPEARQALMTFIIVGGGPTGVELAGALRELARFALAADFRRIDPTTARVVLLEGGPRILSAYPPDLSDAAVEKLKKLGVEVFVNAQVMQIDARGVAVKTQSPPPWAQRAGGQQVRMNAGTVIWAAGVAATDLMARLGVPLDRAGRVAVDRDLSVPVHPEVYAIGDIALFVQDGSPLPGISPVAMQMGRHAAGNIVRRLYGAATQPFRYRDRGMLATIGRSAAVGMIDGLKLRGWIAWMVWWSVHIFFLIGFRNRIIVLIEWVYSYFTYSRGARLITQRSVPEERLDQVGKLHSEMGGGTRGPQSQVSDQGTASGSK